MYTNLDARQGASNPRNFLWYYNEGQYFVITNITGRRNQTVWNADGTLRSFQTNGFVGVLDPSSAVPLNNGQTTDNHLFPTFPYLDQWGTMFQMDGPITMPGGRVIDWLNWWGETVSESHSDRIGFSFFRLEMLSKQEYVQQTSTGLSVMAPCTLQSGDANLVQLPFTWLSVPTDGSQGNWNASATGTLSAYGPMSTTTSGRSAYTIRGVAGTRVFTFANGTQRSQTIVGASDKGYDLTIYSTSPYILAEAQLVFLLDSAAIFADSDAQTAAGSPYGPYVTLLNPADYYTNNVRIEESGGRLQTETSGQFFQTVNNPDNVVSFSFISNSQKVSSSGSSSRSLSGGAIAGIIVGCVVGVLLIAAVLSVCWWGANRSKSRPPTRETSVQLA